MAAIYDLVVIDADSIQKYDVIYADPFVNARSGDPVAMNDRMGYDQIERNPERLKKTG
ncbi:hypothetical protein [Paraburkholderia domus]|uniref:hypothetical protein n=1 Tax=Paraburkholderia domus TaxID=2793075 RepID=UPI0019145196|nr:hypothetical protein [Paraburkholderia domus]MBK5164824.1 hypothetical protein [Burkholderia sp. R-70211]